LLGISAFLGLARWYEVSEPYYYDREPAVAKKKQRKALNSGGFAFGRQRYDMEPEFLHRPDCHEVLIVAYGLYQITCNVLVIGTRQIAFLFAAADHNYRDSAKLGVGLHGGQDLIAVDPGQVQVQEHEVGTGGVGVLSLPPKKRQRFLSIGGGVDLIPDSGVPESRQHQVHICWIIVDHQDLDGALDFFLVCHTLSQTEREQTL